MIRAKDNRVVTIEGVSVRDRTGTPVKVVVTYGAGLTDGAYPVADLKADGGPEEIRAALLPIEAGRALSFFEVEGVQILRELIHLKPGELERRAEERDFAARYALHLVRFLKITAQPEPGHVQS